MGGRNRQKMTILIGDIFFEGPGNHCISKKEIKTKIPNEEKIKTILTVKEFQGFITGKIFKNWNPARGNFGGTMSKIRLRSLDYFLNL